MIFGLDCSPFNKFPASSQVCKTFLYRALMKYSNSKSALLVPLCFIKNEKLKLLKVVRCWVCFIVQNDEELYLFVNRRFWFLDWIDWFMFIVPNLYSYTLAKLMIKRQNFDKKLLEWVFVSRKLYYFHNLNYSSKRRVISPIFFVNPSVVFY